MSRPFEMEFFGRWGDMDFNGHVRNTAYLDVSGDVRMSYFQANGFSMEQFRREGIGPVIMHDELTYHREIRLLEKYRVTLECTALSDDGSRFKLRNRFFREDGTPAVTVTSAGGWLDLQARRLRPPPEKLADVLKGLARSDDFTTLPTRASV